MLSWQPPESPAERDATMPLLLSVAAVAIALGLVVSAVPGLQQRSEHAAERFVDRPAYVESVLHGTKAQGPPERLPTAVEPATREGIVYGLAATALVLAVAAFGLWYRRLPQLAIAVGARIATPPVVALRAMHSGIVGDYLLWIAAGTALIGGIWGITLR